jgi:hypothetical protein
VAQLLGRSRRSGRARSTAADLARAESRGSRQHKESGTERGSLWRGARSGYGRARARMECGARGGGAAWPARGGWREVARRRGHMWRAR